MDEIRESYGFSSEKSKFSGLLSEGKIDQESVYLFKPLTYMNLSGKPVADAGRFFKIRPDHIIVFHDDLDLEPKTVRVKQGGGHGGHNGLKDLDAHLGPDYWRVRIGIGRPLYKDQVTSYVLSNFSKADHGWLDPLLPILADEVHLLVTGAPQEYANKVMAEVSHGI